MTLGSAPNEHTSPLPPELVPCSLLQLLRRVDDEGGEEIEVFPIFSHPADASTKKDKATKKGGDDGLVGGSGGAGEGVTKVVTPEQLKRDVRRVLYWYDDANCLPLVRKGIEKLGIPQHLMEGL